MKSFRRTAKVLPLIVAMLLVVASTAEATHGGRLFSRQRVVVKQQIVQPVVQQQVIKQRVVQRVVRQKVVAPVVQQYVAPIQIQTYAVPQQIIVPQVQQYSAPVLQQQGHCVGGCNLF